MPKIEEFVKRLEAVHDEILLERGEFEFAARIFHALQLPGKRVELFGRRIIFAEEDHATR